MPTYDSLAISHTFEYAPYNNLPFWWDESNVVFSSNDHDSPNMLRLNVQDGTTETLPYLAYSMIRSPSRSPDGQYLSFGKQIHTVPSGETVAQSRLSNNIFYQDTFWNPDGQPWVLQSAYNLYSCCRDHSYEIIQLDGSFTRELTSCYGLGCAGWLPGYVEPFLSPESSPHPIIPAPMHWTTFNSWVENFAWNADYTQIKTITQLDYGESGQYRINVWDAEIQQLVRPSEIFFCATRCPYGWENDPYAPFTLAPGESVINKAASLQVTREEDSETYTTYTIFNLQTGAVVSTWQSFGDNYFRWVGDTLFESSSYNKNICYRHLHPSVSQNRFIEPLGCSFSNDGRYALLTSPRAMQRSRLIDTHSGETVEVNFYGEMGSFSIDGHSIALTSNGFITFWDVEDLMATGR